MIEWNRNGSSSNLSKPVGVGETTASASVSGTIVGLAILGLAGYGLYWIIKRN